VSSVPSDPSSPSFPVSLFGKLPARPDFVREGFGGAAALELEQWLLRAVEHALSAKAVLPEAGVRYAYCSPRSQQVMVGVLIPSRDQVGRTFPLTVFGTIPLHTVVGRLAALPLAFDAFLTQAHAVLRELSTSNAAGLGLRLERLQLPGTDSFAEAQERCEHELREGNALALVERTLGAATLGMHCYAFFTFLTATVPSREAPNAGSTIVLDCPTRCEADRVAWLDLANRLLAGRDALPSCFWLDHPASRLLLSLGPPPLEILRVLGDPQHPGARVWPLVTGRPEAVARARAALSPALAELDPAMTTDRMLRLVAESARG
jgi:type VI secretion system protein ImpM